MKNIEGLLKTTNKKIEEKYLESMDTPFIKHLRDYITTKNTAFKILFQNKNINDNFLKDVSFVINTSKDINLSTLGYEELIKKTTIFYIIHIRMNKPELYLSGLKQANDNFDVLNKQH